MQIQMYEEIAAKHKAEKERDERKAKIEDKKYNQADFSTGFDHGF